uniref:hypothetical protein n=1 Tax=Aliivibrio wodanis TaxID=80852 RepID=UPI001C3EEEBA|nr:hypothetical protein [Aliivibrio wodanis]
MKTSEWSLAFESLVKKTTLICSNVRIISYFIVSILCLGAAGIWLPWLDKAVRFEQFFRADNIFTFVVALLGGLLCNKVFHADRIAKDIFSELKLKLDSAEHHKSSEIYALLKKRKNIYKEQLALSAIGFLIGSVALILVIIGYSEFSSLNNSYSQLGLIISLILYLYATAEDIDDSTQFKVLAEEEPKSTVFEGTLPKSDDLFRDK